ncbi:2-oxoacid:ferredoxin oxidoreductase subunit beta [bacterium]|nr:2-oxoacid:ferredoxin oxidoreductase subunit beta [bacterium]MCI0612258.1 2-oxoacid:ferredoxin oxidoreductase subunit beta [bacterium]
MSTTIAPTPLTRKDFESDQEVRWCPGCGDYSILAQTQKVLPELGVPREKFVFVSGIGCSSRFPYYVNTYGFHSIHGRAPAIATGVKASRPDLFVWVVTGDGDGLSIGGNHLVHCMRRNVDLKIILFNNRIYGLTKGQYSPTSEFGKKTKSTPMGSIDYPVNPIHLAIAAEATFVARSFDIDTKHMQETLVRAAKHKGTAFVEVFQNCNIFNDGAFKGFTDKDVRDDRVIYVQHGKPLIYGKNHDKGLRLNGTNLEVVTLGNGVSESDLLVYNEEDPSPVMAYLVSALEFPHFPVPVGVFRNISKPTYDELMEGQIQKSIDIYGQGNLEKLLNAGDTWVVE